MRIVLTVHQFLPDFSAGTEVLTYSCAKELQRRGHFVEVWTGYPDERPLEPAERFDEYLYDAIPVRRYRHSFRTASENVNRVEAEYENPFFGNAFARYLQRARPDLVHFFHLGRLSGAPISACWDQGVPSVFTATDFWFICPVNQLRLPDNSSCFGPDPHRVNCVRHIVERTQSDRLGRVFRSIPYGLLAAAIRFSARPWWPEKKYAPLVQALVRRPERLTARMNEVDRILVSTAFMQQVMVRYGIEDHRIRRIGYGIDLSPFEHLPAKRSADRLRLGFVGSLTEHKGAHVLVDALRALPAEFPVDVSLYGRLDEVPGYVEVLRRRAAGDQRIRFDGTFPNDRIAEVMAGIDVLVVPSIWYENTPLVVYSAQAARVPLVASDVPGLRESIQDGVNGLLFEMGNAGALAGIIRRLAGDRALLEDLRQNAARPKSIVQYVDELEALYAELVADRRGAPAGLPAGRGGTAGDYDRFGHGDRDG
ncbi:MAG: glycosyltransferase [Anaerolineales bacterium]